MDELEFARAWDGISGGLEDELINEARCGRAKVMIAAAVLRTASGVHRVADASDDAGDGEGAAPVSHLVARAEPNLQANEGISLECVDASLSADGSWTVTARRERCRARKRLDDIYDEKWVREKIRAARTTAKDAVVSVTLLSMPDGLKRVVFTDRELGDNCGRRGCADLMRPAWRLRLLRPGETLERRLLTFTRSNSGWIVVSRRDPVRGEASASE